MSIIDYIVTFLSYCINKKKRNLIQWTTKFSAKKGIEIGGPSAIFNVKGNFPVYLFAKAIDGVNFSSKTLWESNLAEGITYNYYKNKKGYQYIAEASELPQIETNKYDFLLSSHSLEHVANPIKALFEWNRIIKPGGSLILILPNKEFTFDINRPYTNFNHLLDDFNNHVGEDDTTHFEEALSLHDLSLDYGIDSVEAFKIRTSNNLENRGLHHHIFNFELITQILEYTGFVVEYQQSAVPYHLITIARKK